MSTVLQLALGGFSEHRNPYLFSDLDTPPHPRRDTNHPERTMPSTGATHSWYHYVEPISGSDSAQFVEQGVGRNASPQQRGDRFIRRMYRP